MMTAAAATHDPRPIAEIIGRAASSVEIPPEQKNESKHLRQTPAVIAAERLLFRSAEMEKRQRHVTTDIFGKQDAIGGRWRSGSDDISALFRLGRTLKLPLMKRVVNAAAAGTAKGQTFGLTVGAKGAVRAVDANRQAIAVIKEVARQTQLAVPGFTFTSIQISLNARAMLHTDRNNAGPSMAMAAGPFAGGQLCIYGDDTDDISALPAERWHRFYGQFPHMVLPYAGERLSFVAFTHATAFSAGGKRVEEELIRQGFPLPLDYGTTKVVHRSEAQDERLLQAAADVYERRCDEIMHIVTTKSSGDMLEHELKFAHAAGTRAMGWSNLARFIVLGVIASITGGQASIIVASSVGHGGSIRGKSSNSEGGVPGDDDDDDDDDDAVRSGRRELREDHLSVQGGTFSSCEAQSRWQVDYDSSWDHKYDGGAYPLLLRAGRVRQEARLLGGQF